jgi:hypothetical protein
MFRDDSRMNPANLKRSKVGVTDLYNVPTDHENPGVSRGDPY